MLKNCPNRSLHVLINVMLIKKQVIIALARTFISGPPRP